MPLFVPILRLLMLFLNVYDSYKTLKDPPPSSRNAGRPTVRAVSQRKRDMKGCLAVWIVWVSLSMYERTLESIVCLFIPFYDEFKSLALLFLMLTRARGAEPIYLHLIRPMIKPYTRTLDATLEIMLTIGDFIFALSIYPVHLGLQWWHQRVGQFYEPFETEADSQSDSSNDVNTSELPTSFLASSGLGLVPASLRPGQPENSAVRFPRKSSGEKVPMETQSRRPSSDGASRTTSKSKLPETTDNRPVEPTRSQSGSPKQKDTRNQRPLDNSDSSIEPNLFRPLRGRWPEGADAPSRHQVWYPPKASFADEDLEGAQADLTIRPSNTSGLPKNVNQEDILTYEQQQLDEWRQYPPFPSAYPPTPIVTTSRLVSASLAVSSSLYPPIEEEKVQQDFRQSLLPPREPLNPSHAGDLSDKHTFGISPYLVNRSVDAEDSMSTDDYEDEDEFNITLRTPLPPRGSLRSQVQPRRLVSLASASSAASVPSRSSALTTADNGSSLRTNTSSDSSLSGPKSNLISSTVIGKKRSHPRPKASNTKNRVRQIEDEGSQDEEDPSDAEPQNITPPPVSKTRKAKSDALRRLPSASDTADDVPESSSSISAQEEEQEQIPPEEKRRKVVRSQPRVVHPSRPVRPRVSRYASPPPQSQKSKLLELPVAPKRSSVRLRSGVASAHQLKEKQDSLGTSSSASISDRPPPLFPPKPINTRNATRRKRLDFSA